MNNKPKRIILATMVAFIFYIDHLSAQQPAESEYTRIVEKALTEFNAGRWEEARALFAQAHAINPNARR